MINNWKQIINYLHTVDLRKTVCVGCGFAKLYDADGKEHKVTKQQTLEEVKAVVEKLVKPVPEFAKEVIHHPDVDLKKHGIHL